MKKIFSPVFVLLLSLSVSGVGMAKKGPERLQDRPQFDSLSKQEKAVWEDYIKRSRYWSTLDQKLINDELKKVVYKKPAKPPAAKKFGFDPKQAADWYATDAGRRVADIILSFQTPSGGWSKRTDMSQRPRKTGEAFGVEEKYIPTFDNEATTTQIRVLANAFQTTANMDYANAVLQGLYLMYQAQYPNGCWPQTYPLAGDYHDLITYNDNVVTDIVSLLQEVSIHAKPFDFVPADFREAADASVRLGLECILKSQIVVDGKKLVWAAQHNMLDLTPAAARKFEPVSLSSQESAGILIFLMQIPDPGDAVKTAIESGIDWLKQTRINGFRWRKSEHDAGLIADPAAPSLWSRFYEIGSNKPIFGDRDGSVSYDVRTISMERRQGYGWYTSQPGKALKKYAEWKQREK